MLEKLSHQDINGLLIKTAATIRSQNAEISSLRAQLAAKDRREYAEKIAQSAVEKGIMDETDANNYAESLATGDKDLSMVEEFVTSTVSGVPLGEPLQKLASESPDGYSEGDSPEGKFASFLLQSDYQ